MLPVNLIAPLIALCVALAGIGGAYVKGRADGKDIANAEWSAKLVQANEQARQKERELQDKADEVARHAQKRAQILAERVASADLAVAGLLNDIAAAERTSQTAECAAESAAASTARQLLGECAKEYRGVATEADRLSGQVTGLQEFATAVSRVR